MGTERIELSPNANYEAGQLNTYQKTNELRKMIEQEIGIKGNLIEKPIKRSEINVVDLVLTILSSSAAVMFLDILKQYILKNKSLNIELEKEGKRIKINANNFNTDQIEHNVELANKILQSKSK
jgi:hypothetical protein